MLPRKAPSTTLPLIKKRVAGEDATARGAFFCRDTVAFEVNAPRALGAAGVVLRIARDGERDVDYPLIFSDSCGGNDTYKLTLSLAKLCHPRDEGLFYYEFLFLRGRDTLFTDTRDNVTYTLASHSSGRFRLLVSEDGFVTPNWFKGSTMYHIFVDRFAKTEVPHPENTVYHENWNEEIEQFGAYPGAPVANNEFFGGTLYGIIEKLDYLVSLGVNVIYLSPIFKATSNHKYDTGDYETVDPQFGGDEALDALIAACNARGISLMLDGVFNHTGDDSRYFNRRENYDTVGAYQSKESPYFDWFYFLDHPKKYLCWWDIEILPKLCLGNPDVHNYFVGKGGIIERYTRRGIRGWRLDVADELPNAFLDELRVRVKEETAGEGVVLGEVWENAADKIAYGKRRRYFGGRQLDSVMNYPLRRGILSFVRDGNAGALAATLRELWGSYPKAVCHSLMNILSTHDTERILTVLGGPADDGSRSNAALRVLRLTDTERKVATARLLMAATLQYTVFGVPSVFYGDEAGLEGYHDPFCRRPFPWGAEDPVLQAHYKKLGALRKAHSALKDGDFELLLEQTHAIAFARKNSEETIVVAANRGADAFTLTLPRGKAAELFSGKKASGKVSVPPNTANLWRIKHA